MRASATQSSGDRPMLAGVEAGGTKIVCMVGSGPDRVTAIETVPTTTPTETLGRVAEFFTDIRAAGTDLAALGIASFGPLDLDPTSLTYGHVTTTPKPGWRGTNILGWLRDALDVPTSIDTDVNGAAYGEYLWGAGRGTSNVAYLTVGTGIGGGAVVAGRPLHGLVHPEMGHLSVVRHPADRYPGRCPFHGDCLEGLASGPALAERFGRAPESLEAELPEARELTAWYVAQLVCAITYVLSPERVVIGGGVLGMPGLLEAIRLGAIRRLKGALPLKVLEGVGAGYVVAPELGKRSGVLGAIALALQQVQDEHQA